MLTRDIAVGAHASRQTAALAASPAWPEARQLAFDCAGPLPPVSLPLAAAAGRTLTRHVTALQSLPHYASSAMDGWAVNGAGPWILAEPGHALSADHAGVIATGGLVPEGAEAILRKESGQVTEGPAGTPLLRLNAHAKDGEPRRGQHMRPAGEEATAGDVLIPAGTILNPAHIALAAVAGHDEVQVQAKPTVAVVLTGSEVVTSGVPAPGQVRDTFGPQLGTVISLLGGTPVSPLRIGDSYEEWLTALADAAAPSGQPADVTITTGGTGRSGTDHFRAAVTALGGQVLLDGVAMRPGHPAVLAKLSDGRFVVGLPGNPLAAMMALMTIGAPLLAALGGGPLPPVDHVLSGNDIEPDPGRTRLIPCKIIHGLAFPAAHTGPGMMRGLAWADCVMAVPPHGVDSGERVPVLPLPWSSATIERRRDTPWHA